MSLRSLSVGYLVCAAIFGTLVVRHDHPDWAAMTDRVALEWRDAALTRIADATKQIFPDHAPPPPWAEQKAAPAPDLLKQRRELERKERIESPKPVAIAPDLLKPEIAELPPDAPTKPTLPDVRMAEVTKPEASQPKAPKERLAKPVRPALPADLPPAPPRVSVAPNPAELARVRERLQESLTTELSSNFELFLYVSKAEAGPWAQHMYVFERRNGDLKPLYVWPVSTGREKVEYNKRGQRLPSFTPAGYYQLDPKRSYRKYRSVQWDQNMPWAMFFTWIKDGNETGLAIHGADGADIALLGQRSSAGCVRLAPENAEALYNLIRGRYRGQTPKFAYDRRTATMSNQGMLKRDADGRLDFDDGYKVLVFIENYGGQDVVAALY